MERGAKIVEIDALVGMAALVTHKPESVNVKSAGWEQNANCPAKRYKFGNLFILNQMWRKPS